MLFSLIMVIGHVGKAKEKGVLKILKVPILFMAVFIGCILVRVFFFEVYYIPSGSMENTLFEGDYVLVSKINYGPRIPSKISEIPWLNFFSNGESVNPSERRLRGIGTISANDVLVFNNVHDADNYYVKRCIGLPGQSVSMRNNKICINGKEYAETENIKNNFQIVYDGENFSEAMRNAGIIYNEDWLSRNNTHKEISLTAMQKLKLQSIPSLKFLVDSSKNDSVTFGPLWIPRKGSTIDFQGKNKLLYRNTIAQFESKRWVNNSARPYMFSKNYYFVLGDNRVASTDSRVWGLLPESYVVGKAVMVIFSFGKNSGTRWNRFFKPIR
ncbi:signal peptidase I [Mucilaginibacter sp. HD30]